MVGLFLILGVWGGPVQARSLVSRSTLNKIERKLERSLIEASVRAPEDLETCFSPKEPCDVKLVRFIQSAKKSLDLAIYDINLDQLVHEILVQSKKIPVRVIVDRRQAKGSHSLVPLLIKAGAQVRYGRQRGIFHHKFTLVDQKMVETGSFNYTNHASTANRENQVYLAHPKIVEAFQKQFNDAWAEAALPQ